MTYRKQPLSRRQVLEGALGGAVLTSAQATAQLGRAQSASSEAGASTATKATEASVLRTISAHVLPQEELGSEELEHQVQQFESWAASFEPVAELDHPYLSSDELRYGPPDPRPNWQAQLRALDDESQKRWETSYTELSPDRQYEMLERHLQRALPRTEEATPLPFAAEAPHVAIALLAWFTSTSFANDLCYGKAIGRHECRGLPSAKARPEALPTSKGRNR